MIGCGYSAKDSRIRPKPSTPFQPCGRVVGARTVVRTAAGRTQRYVNSGAYTVRPGVGLDRLFHMVKPGRARAHRTVARTGAVGAALGAPRPVGWMRPVPRRAPPVARAC